MTETHLRPVPHINHTQALAEAAHLVRVASVPTGLEKIENPMDVIAVREALRQVGRWFEDPQFFFPDDPDGELKAAEYSVLVMTLFRDHLRAGNYT